MNQRSKRLWIENVAWTLVVSMSVLQLTSGSQWKAAQAGQFDCWTTILTPKDSLDCTGCSDAACFGGWREVSRYETCEAAAKGFWFCATLPGAWNNKEVGQDGDCVEQYSLIAITICAGSGKGGSSGPCASACAPLILTGAGYPGCIALCVAGAGAGTATACCTVSCFCITRCYKGVGAPIRRQRVELKNPGCPTDGGG